MKKYSVIVMLTVLFGAIFGPVKTASAMANGADAEVQQECTCVTREGVWTESSQTDAVGQVVMERTEVYPVAQQRDTTHTERILNARHDLYVDDVRVAWVIVGCTVWDYPDGKVHLYSRSMSLAVTPGYEASYLTYGSIFNTDGTYSGTTGDRVCLSDGTFSAHFGLYFYVTTETYNFSNSRIYP